MNREIKFRVWDSTLNIMITEDNVEEVVKRYEDKNVDYQIDEWYMYIPFDIGLQDDKVLMQYTGLHDKNGVEIYEGDIVKNILILDNNTIHPNVDIVEYNQEDCSFMLGKNKRHFNKKLDLEVLGNIFENKEN